MLFSPMVLAAAGATIGLAVLEKTLDDYGYYFLGNVLKLAIPIAAFAAGVYFIETNAMIGWLK